MINENEINTITNHDVIVEEPSLSSRATKKSKILKINAFVKLQRLKIK